MHDLLFTLPGATYPFASCVRVDTADGHHVVRRWHQDQLVEESTTDSDHVDAILDTCLERLAEPALVCRYCGLPVTVSSDQFKVFESMHYSCFHYLFEHTPFDPDEECTAGGCPSASIGPNHRPEEPRDSLVEVLIDDLMASEVAAEAMTARIERRGPGAIAASFDANTYLITVRTQPQAR